MPRVTNITLCMIESTMYGCMVKADYSFAMEDDTQSQPQFMPAL
jgi:hypothetical protein